MAWKGSRKIKMSSYDCEEKQAIEILKEFKKTGFHTLRYKYNKDRRCTVKLIENAIETLLNLIEKQQKEIELATKSYDKALDMLVDKDNKIREKIKELKSIGKYQLDHKNLYLEQETIDVLQELLGEEK